MVSFTNYISARERLNAWVDDFALCLNYCGLNKDGGECFNRQIRKCYGICCGEESVAEYNLRAKKIVDEYLFENRNFLLLDKGRHEDEQSVILIENGHFAGYGYVDKSEAISSAEELKSYILQKTYYPDADELVRFYLKRKNKMKRILF